MVELVTIPVSYFEYSAQFKRPVFALLAEQATVVQALFDALAPWKLEIDDVEHLTIGKLSEQGINMKLMHKRATFFFGHASCKFTQDGADWASADETLEILDTARRTLLTISEAAIDKQTTVLAIHLQPRSKSFIELLAPFIPQKIRELHATEAIKTAAAIVKWEKRKLILDGSGSIANGLFLRLEREFTEDVTLKEMAGELRADEEAAFTMLGVEEDRS